MSARLTVVALVVLVITGSALAPTESKNEVVTDIDRLLDRNAFVEAFALAVERTSDASARFGSTSPQARDGLATTIAVAFRNGDLRLAQSLVRMLVAEQQEHGAGHAIALGRAHLLAAKIERNLDARRAESHLREAERILARNMHAAPELWAGVLQQKGNVTRSRNTQRAIDLYRWALEVRLADTPRPRYALFQNLTWLGWNLQNGGRNSEARRVFAQAREIGEQAGLERSFEAAVIELALGEMAATEGNWEAARPHFQRRIDLIDGLWWSSSPGFPKRQLGWQSEAALAAWQLRSGEWEAAWDTASGGRHRISNDFIQLARWPQVDPEGYRAVNTLMLQRTALKSIQSSCEQGDWDTVLATLALEARIQKMRREFLKRHHTGSPTISQLQARLRDDEAYIGWLDTTFGAGNLDERSEKQRRENPILANRWVYVIRPGSIEWIELRRIQSYDELQQENWVLEQLVRTRSRAATWPTPLEDDPQINRHHRVMAERLLVPVLPALEGVERLIVENSWEVPSVPVESLILPGGVQAAERFSVTYVPSPMVFLLTTRENRVSRVPSRALLVGDPARELPFSALEIEQLAAMFPESTTLAREDATERRILNLIDSSEALTFDTIHFATHVRATAADGNGIMLSENEFAGSLDDGVITAQEILDRWKLDAELVTLSGCRSLSLSRNDHGQAMPLTQAFLASGVRSIVASLWDVDDRATQLLMNRFYANLLGTDGPARPKALALRDARNWLKDYRSPDGKQPYRHPVYWSGFVLIGSPD